VSKRSSRRRPAAVDPELQRRMAAFSRRPGPRLWSNEEIADELLRRLADFSPALSIGPGDQRDIVEVQIIMCRKPEPDLLDELIAEGEQESPGFAERVERQTSTRWAARAWASRHGRRSDSV
jgi:hypothetical protein